MVQAVVQRQKNIVPKFTVEPGGPYIRNMATYNKEKKTFEYHQVEEKESFILKFPRGHSIRVRTMEQVKELVGDPEQVELVDLETSDVMGVQHVPLKSKKERN